MDGRHAYTQGSMRRTGRATPSIHRLPRARGSKPSGTCSTLRKPPSMTTQPSPTSLRKTRCSPVGIDENTEKALDHSPTTGLGSSSKAQGGRSSLETMFEGRGLVQGQRAVSFAPRTRERPTVPGDAGASCLHQGEGGVSKELV